MQLRYDRIRVHGSVARTERRFKLLLPSTSPYDANVILNVANSLCPLTIYILW